MAPFLSHIDFQNKGSSTQDRIDKVTLFIDDYFDSQASDNYYIMDPYLRVSEQLQEPFRRNELEDNIWSSIISMLARDDVNFFLITNDIIREDIPIEVLFPKNENPNVKIEACYFPNGKFYEDYSLHDRYILKKNENNISGLHIGCSLGDIHNKDVTITILEETDINSALENFAFLWSQCKTTKGWKKN